MRITITSYLNIYLYKHKKDLYFSLNLKNYSLLAKALTTFISYLTTYSMTLSWALLRPYNGYNYSKIEHLVHRLGIL